MTINAPLRSLMPGPGTTAGVDGAGTFGLQEMLPSGVTAGSYTSANITVTAGGIITSAANGSGGGGSQNIVTVRVVTAAGAITMLNTDQIVVVNKTVGASSAVTLLSSPATGQICTIKDGKGDAATNNITITPAAGNIDGAGTFVINLNYGSVDLVYNGTQWNVY